jgi:hypothetical protein
VRSFQALSQGNRGRHQPAPVRLASLITATAALVLAVALAAAPAQAHHKAGSFSCSTTHWVYTSSKSAGQTDHYQWVSGRVNPHHRNFGNVSPSNPWRHWTIQHHSITGWQVTAAVLESHSANCQPAPQ